MGYRLKEKKDFNILKEFEEAYSGKHIISGTYHKYAILREKEGTLYCYVIKEIKDHFGQSTFAIYFFKKRKDTRKKGKALTDHNLWKKDKILDYLKRKDREFFLYDDPFF